MPVTLVEIQKPLSHWLPQHNLPTNNSCRDMHFTPQPNDTTSLHIPVLSLNKCKTGVLHALNFSLAVSEYFIPTKKCPIFTCMWQLHSKEENTVLNADVGPISVISPLCSCSSSFLSSMGQANRFVNVRQELKHVYFCTGEHSHGAWISTCFSCSLPCFLARSFSDL